MSVLTKKLYQQLYLVRMAEEKIRELYPQDEMKTPVHLAIGEEAVAVGVCGALGPEDKIFATYRNHGIYLARTGNTDEFFAELYGRSGGMFAGKGGSMHISSPENGFLGTSAVVGTTIPLALGCAHSLIQLKKPGFAVAFFGDGAVDEGAFWESLNFASLKKLPIIFVCEDNNLAIHTFAKDRHGYKSINRIVSQFECNTFESNSTDVEEISNLTKKAKTAWKKNGKPSFLHLHYYRYLEHVGINTDFQFGYRGEDEFKKWFRKDPVRLQRRRLKALGLTEEKIKGLENLVLKKIDKSVQLAGKSKFPGVEELTADVYAES